MEEYRTMPSMPLNSESVFLKFYFFMVGKEKRAVALESLAGSLCWYAFRISTIMTKCLTMWYVHQTSGRHDGEFEE